MSSASTSPQLAERQDIHKSCRTLETLVNMLNDYCEAAGAIVALQKKLSKALKEAASLKTTSEIAANALSVSASIFDVLSDVDAKFAKIADKECSGVSSEVRKWFKKLAKEEKAHDERMNESNTRIKQAGQTYEKKVKKSARDVSEEHARYVNLLSVLGPEMSQEKYNHALLVTQQHTSTTYNVAACLSRVADAEWVRTCESIRRFSPSIGPLGEWRALCEGAWTGPLPDDLPDVSLPHAQAPPPNRGVTEWGQTIPSGKQPYPGSLPFPSQAIPVDLERPHPAFSSNEQNQGSINSITTLSAFPFPPTHFPVPLAINEAELQRQRMQMQSLHVPHPSQTTQQTYMLSESPTPVESALSDTQMLIDSFRSPTVAQGQITPSSSQYTYAGDHPEERMLQEKARSSLFTSSENTVPEQSHVEAKPRRPSLITRATSREKSQSSKPLNIKQPERPPPEREFGASSDTRSAFKSRSIDVAKMSLERSESSVSNGSIVAVMRSRYSRTIEPSSQAPKDVPRLPMSVSDLASRYQPIDEPMTPRRSNGSPTGDGYVANQDFPAGQATRDGSIGEEEIRRRRQRIEELAELELNEKEYELRQRERELNQKARDFERNRMQFQDAQGDLSDPPKGPRSTPGPFQHKRGSQSTSHLVPPSTSTAASPQPRGRGSQSPSRSQPSSPLPAKGHAPFCGCDSCSVTKYKAPDVTPSPYDLRPPEPPILLRPEKPKGWIRRLSMPAVGAAFSMDAKKNASATSLVQKSGLSSPAENGRRRKGSFEQGISNRSVGMVRR
ncbi:hypothetical protein K503DRAFT_683164 [Rhizopogon vinicolor AM-OR11-026]|uniref:IMD domain-containing protein n=1 Tax=Rhizopogon vinicolor AM-OR11-026 TaxID=1314800 RepID=A0A1B7NC94_9AGAM|nr:hypothetical protein K503DRAFT_683164 [Rhizopogon vinicolor AM-OR11-026]